MCRCPFCLFFFLKRKLIFLSISSTVLTSQSINQVKSFAWDGPKSLYRSECVLSELVVLLLCSTSGLNILYNEDPLERGGFWERTRGWLRGQLIPTLSSPPRPSLSLSLSLGQCESVSSGNLGITRDNPVSSGKARESRSSPKSSPSLGPGAVEGLGRDPAGPSLRPAGDKSPPPPPQFPPPPPPNPAHPSPLAHRPDPLTETPTLPNLPLRSSQRALRLSLSPSL